MEETIDGFPELAGICTVGSDELGVVQSFGSENGFVVRIRGRA